MPELMTIQVALTSDELVKDRREGYEAPEKPENLTTAQSLSPLDLPRPGL